MLEKQVEYVFEASLGENDRAWLGGTFLSMVGIGNFLRDINQVCLALGRTCSVVPDCLSWELTGLSLLNNCGVARFIPSFPAEQQAVLLGGFAGTEEAEFGAWLTGALCQGALGEQWGALARARSEPVNAGQRGGHWAFANGVWHIHLEWYVCSTVDKSTRTCAMGTLFTIYLRAAAQCRRPQFAVRELFRRTNVSTKNRVSLYVCMQVCMHACMYVCT